MTFRIFANCEIETSADRFTHVPDSGTIACCMKMIVAVRKLQVDHMLS